MTRPIISITDAVTKEQVIREMNDEEFAKYEAEAAETAE
jgi:hypothetical protein